VKQLVNAMAAVCFDYTAVSIFGVLLDDRSRFTEKHTWFDKGNGLVEALTSGLDNTHRGWIGKCFGADIVGFVQIAMEAAMVERHIEIDDVPIQ